jgi:hypothetical protein
MRRWIHRIAIALTLLFVIGLIVSWWAVEQTQYVPEFYQRATKPQTAGSQRTRRPLTTEIRQVSAGEPGAGVWNADFSDDEINAWLIEELPTKFPRLLAKGASEPRIVIEDDRVLAAVRYKNRSFDIVISCELEVELTEQANMLALRVKDLKAGALPLPLSNFLKGISKEAAKGDIDIRWDVTDSGPVALVTVPSEHPRYVDSPVIVESVQLVERTLVLAGHAGPLAHDFYRPQGPLYRFVSYRPGEKSNRQQQLSSKREPSPGKLR